MANCLFCGDWDCCCGGTSGSSSGGGTGYTLPTASTTRKGGIKVGEGLEMNGDTLNVILEGGSDYSLPTASSTRKGGIKVRNGDDGLKMEGDYLTVTLTGGSDYSLKPATSYRLGGIIVGDGLEIDTNGVLSCSLTGGSGTAEDTSESEFNRFVFGEG